MLKNNKTEIASKTISVDDVNKIECDIISKYNIKSNGFKMINVENLKFEWIIPNFLLKQSLNMIYAGAGSGKSMFALYLSKYIIQNDPSIDEIIYFDADNGEATLADRKIDKFVELKKLKYILANNSNRFALFKNINKNNKTFKNIIFIIDSIRNFMNVSLNKDDKVTKFLADLQGIRDKGATIIFLHHQPKQGSDKNDEKYKGATAFMDSVDEAYYLTNEVDILKADYEMIVSLKPKKQRNNTKEIAFKIDTNNLTLSPLNSIFIGLSDKEKISLQLAKEIIDCHPNGITQSELAATIQKMANKNYYEIVGRNVLWRLFDKFDGKLFKIIRTGGKGNFKKLFYRLV